MESTRIDAISKLFARRRLSRRQMLLEGSAGLVAAGVASAAYSGTTSAQEATPDAATPVAGGGKEYPEYPKMLFVQSYQSGSIAPKDDAEGQYTITLEHGLGQTLFFTDRPDRKVGASPTGDFLKGLGFAPDNPPNAALVVETADGGTDIAVVELFSPTYDEASHSTTYEATVLEDWEDALAMGFSKAPVDLATFAPSFGAANLFIDDCADGVVTCTSGDTDYPCPGNLYYGDQPICGTLGPMGYCYNWSEPGCWPCDPYDHLNPPADKLYEYWENQCAASFPVCTEGGRQDVGCYPNF